MIVRAYLVISLAESPATVHSIPKATRPQAGETRCMLCIGSGDVRGSIDFHYTLHFTDGIGA